MRTLRRKMQGMLFEPTAISRRPEELARQELERFLLYLRWLDRYERRPGEEPPIGLILCGEKKREQIELLQLDQGEIRVAEYLVELPPKGLLEAKLHEAIRLARGQVEAREE